MSKRASEESRAQVDSRAGTFVQLWLDQIESSQNVLAARVADLEGVVFGLKAQLATLEQPKPRNNFDAGCKFVVTGVRANGEILVVSEQVGFDRARSLGEQLLANGSFHRILIEFDKPQTGHGTIEYGRLETLSS